MKKIILLILFITVPLVFTNCAGLKYGSTKNKAFNHFLLVDEERKNFGYKRFQHNLGYNWSLKGFVNEHGLPDLIYEYNNEQGYDSILLCYMSENIVYVYESQSWLANSLFLKEQREPNEYEQQTFLHLNKDNNE